MNIPGDRIDWTSVKERLARGQSLVTNADQADGDRLRDVFHQRARRLAKRGRQESTERSTIDVLVFQLGDERFGIALSQVRQAFARVLITPVPGANDSLIGIANLNGSLRSVADLGRLLRLSAAQPTATYVVLLSAQDKLLAIGVEALEEVYRVDLGRLSPVESPGVEAAGFITGRTDHGIALLDAVALIHHAAMCNRLNADLKEKDAVFG